ncbi:hypothetical protein HH310_41330 [Actinoplanes sp. TBRC 11911]|uniref:hypothetical protein n=1 Tax=Actinoplanes sp. TBRC 11911 TaxID=2729386 RepID=UPI00145D063F|nr:hypothetical protein [Actinoplanes sp. TBRC 11911]NMO57597.1 hypothetical protein [Actinoplanes sp. TBRC 11911]
MTTTYLSTADKLLTTVVPGTRGAWPRAYAWLLRLELEAVLDEFWTRVRPDIGETQAQRPKLLMLTAYAGPDIGRSASYLWWALSRAGHHHRYELGLTVSELLRLRDELKRLTGQLIDGPPRHVV